MPSTVNVGFHWLTFATGKGSAEVMERMGGGFGKAEGRGAFGHPHRSVHESGAAVYHGSAIPGQPVVVNVPGEVCEGWAPQALTWASECLGWVTRLDVAADLEPPELARRRLVEMHRATKMKRVDTRLKHHTLTKSDNPGDGWTGYWGKRGGHVMMRAYDRRGPLRLEWEWRPERETGQYVPEIAAKRGPECVWRSLAGLAVFPMKWYRDLLEGDTVEWSTVPKTDAAFVEALEQFAVQWGQNLWAWNVLGVDLTKLARAPEELRGDLAAKYLRWADEAGKKGYDGAKLRAEVMCRLKSKRG